MQRIAHKVQHRREAGVDPLPVQQPRTATTLALCTLAISATSFLKRATRWAYPDGGTAEKSITFAHISSPSKRTR